MKRQAALRGLVAGATAVAATAVAGGPARAGTGTVTYDCQMFASSFTYTAEVEVSGPPSPAGVGDTVRIEADLSDLPGVAPLKIDSWRTTAKLLASGAQSGTYDLTGPRRKGPVEKKKPLPIGELTARVPLTAGGTVDFTLGTLTLTGTSFGISVPITCRPKGRTPKLLSLKVRGESSPATLLADPATVAPGAGIKLSGSGWGSGEVKLALCREDGTACDAGGLTDVTTSVADGKLTGGAKVKEGTATGTYKIKASQGDTAKLVAIRVEAPGGETETDPCAGKEPEQCGQQDVTVTVTGGPLTLAQDPGEVVLDPVTLNGTAQTTTGTLRKVTVSDARGSSVGWSLIGTLSDFKGPAGASIAAGNLTWTPQCAARAGATPVVTGTPGPLGEAGVLLCSTADSTAGPVGGTYDAGAALSLNVPAATASGEYDAVLTLTLS
ncbi:hypothetical protein GCM10009550_66730 [Actinocorallia libanotica]|uniref:Beta-xylosidase n=2 Tax=Actinocorallia libanotica TaxID=46162 RepID=A0ABP4CCU3_9ACTN